jgi:hypothetical protein
MDEMEKKSLSVIFSQFLLPKQLKLFFLEFAVENRLISIKKYFNYKTFSWIDTY